MIKNILNLIKARRMNLSSILEREPLTLLDVREVREFQTAHAEGAINIPLSQIPARIEEIRQMQGTIVAYCLSGNRSGQAVRYLEQQGLREVYNGGSLNNILRNRQMVL